MSGNAEQYAKLEVPVDSLRRTCGLPETVTDQSVAGASSAYLGQQRAIDAIRFGIQMDCDGYNIFILGPLGSHRHALAEELAKESAKQKGAPNDWVYINNFSNPERPRALRLPAGRGRELRDRMHAAGEEIRLAIPAAFETDDYRDQLKVIEAETKKTIAEQWQSLNQLAAQDSIGVMHTPTGYVLAPLKDDKVIDDKEFEKLPQAERERIEASIHRLSEELQLRIEIIPRLRKQHHERVRALDQEVAAHAVRVLLEELKNDFRALPDVLAYLDEVEQDIIRNAQQFRRSEEPALPFLSTDPPALLASYEVNLVVSNEAGAAAPIIYEPNPNYPNLIGKIEHRAEMGAMVTDFRLLRSGALLQANGGYLLLDMHRVLGRPFVWEALKQALFTRKVRIESPADSLGFVSAATLRPEPIPLDIKVMLIGERWLYYLLSQYDKEFSGLFKVAADLDDDLERSAENVSAYAQLVADRIRQRDLLPFSADAVQKIIEQRARQAGDSERLSTHMRSLDDLLMQADHWARHRGADRAAPEDVAEALRQKDRRLDRLRNRVHDAIERETLLIDTSGACIGQVNGLSVVELGEFRFGQPTRITATTRVGNGNVVDIEREVELGGAIHSKGMMILSAALAARYASEVPLSLHGSVVFEQSYGGVEGDSASVAELCALLSSISRVPIRQSIAVTGSINQLGRVQAVGGINEKIEGCYAICKERGLDGSHGVVIPADNVKHLMLREEVVDAVRHKQFNVYAVQFIDEAIAVLTGETAGERDSSSGLFPLGSVNRKVEDQLLRYAQCRQQFSASKSGNEQRH